jgi:hypothetical protein
MCECERSTNIKNVKYLYIFNIRRTCSTFYDKVIINNNEYTLMFISLTALSKHICYSERFADLKTFFSAFFFKKEGKK